MPSVISHDESTSYPPDTNPDPGRVIDTLLTRCRGDGFAQQLAAIVLSVCAHVPYRQIGLMLSPHSDGASASKWAQRQCEKGFERIQEQVENHDLSHQLAIAFRGHQLPEGA